MIRHIAGSLLRVQRWQTPEGPWWCASAVSPCVGAVRSGLDIDWLTLRAHAVTRGEMSYCTRPAEMLEREKRIDGPLLIAAPGLPEAIHEGGAALLPAAAQLGLTSIFLTSTEGAVPAGVEAGEVAAQDTVVVAVWPLDGQQLERRFVEASAWPSWGICVPLLHPVTTSSPVLDELCRSAAAHGAQFAVGALVESEPEALATLAIDGGADDAVWDALFDGSAELLAIGAARHLAASAREQGLDIRCPLPADRSNWAAAARLAAIAERLFQLEKDSELAWRFHRAAGLVASLPKQLWLIAETASLHIVEGLEEPMIECLEQWLAGSEPELLVELDSEWPLARVYR